MHMTSRIHNVCYDDAKLITQYLEKLPLKFRYFSGSSLTRSVNCLVSLKKRFCL